MLVDLRNIVYINRTIYIYINTQLNTMMGVPIFCQFNGETEEKSVDLGIPHFFDLGRIREHILEYQLTMIYHI